MAKAPSGNAVYRFFYSLERWVGSGLYEFSDWFGRVWGAYTARITLFRVSGPPRVLAELGSDGLTLGLIAALGILYYALPPFAGTGDIWNRGREYAVTLTDAGGQIVGRRGVRQDDNISLGDIPPHVIKAVLATEDVRFFTHLGVDIQGTFRALNENLRANDVVQGGSTITQQLAKNLFLSPEKTFRRKVNEAFLALWIEARLTKPEILKLYLDRSYLGGGTYGVEAASQFYFGKSVRDVNLAEAAMLAGLFKAPSTYAPHLNAQVARARANVVLYRMLDAGFISQGELFAARRMPADTISQSDYYAPDYFLDFAYNETLRLLQAHGLDREFVIEVKTTIDLELNKHAQQVIDKFLDEEGPPVHATQGALVSMTPEGAVKAIVGGRSYEESQFNRATDALRQPGSAFKPIVYLAALRAGFRPDTIVYDVPIWIGTWSPKNYNRRYSGRTTLASALRRSINTIPVHLAQKIGRQLIVETAALVGIRTPILPVASMPIGTNEVTLMDLTAANATFANGGKRVTPFAVLEIRRPNGELLYSRERQAPPLRQEIDPVIVADLNYMLSQVVSDGTGRRAQLGFTPQAGKTGTNQAYRDAWFMGFTAHYVTGVWFGNDDFTPMKRVTGGTIPAMAWKAYMEKALETQIAQPLPGVPLDNSYAAYLARRESENLSLPIASITDAPDAGGQQATRLGRPQQGVAANEAQQRQRVRRADPVANVFQSLFGLFGGNRRQAAAPPPPAPPAARQAPAQTQEREYRSNFQSRFSSDRR